MMLKAAATISSSSLGTIVPEKLNFRFRWLFLDFPLWIVLIVWASTRLIHHLYLGPIQILIESYRRTGIVDEQGFYPDFFPDLTYYGRHCDASDISTSDSNDLIVPPEATKEEATNIMMTHGAVMIQNLLSNDTATQLRAYLETRNVIKNKLPWHEKFWGDIGRLSLGLGVDDAPIIGQALEEVGSNPTLRTVLQGILGPDPAIVEISTLTALHGAKDQGIHTDSDFFGSSLLYSRTFLHSYTLFMALQDTTSKMGATTICPGTHWCANENLEDICLPGSDEAPHAFEASSNGETGRETGMLYQGDGMMFNQNIWHRGPRNDDPERPINRVMFILTFVSRQDHSKGDVRQQGLGTYYYQRWNMWGHTFEDLKRARKVMTQPVAALRAMGVWKLPDTKWGISWFEHFARQLANNEDFFADYELPDFLNFLDSVPIPRWLRGQQRKMIEKIVLRDEDLQWESFLKQLSTNIARFVDSIHLIAVGAYATIHILSIVITRHGTSSFVKRTLFKYIVVGLLWFSLWYYVTKESYIGKRIHLREAWRQPVSNYSSLEHLELTTLPTRYDVLIGSRFDTPYLASFNHLLDYHPGNKELIKAVSAFESHELVLAFMSQPRQGVTPRFLKQDWQTGYWSLVSPRETVDYIRRQLYVKHNPLIARLDEFIKITLASSRFGPRREKAISRRFTTQLVIDLQTKLYRVIDSCVNMSQNAPVTTKSAKQKEMHVQYFSVIKRPIRSTLSLKTPTTLLFRNSNGSLRFVRQGDRILAPLFEIGEYAEATLVQVISRELVQVKYAFNDELDMVPIIGIRPYRSFVQGDKVEILDGREGKWLSGKILMMHPMAHASILYIDGTGAKKIVDKVPLDMIRFVDKAPQTLEVLITIIKYAKGDRIRAKFQGNAWFLGVVDQLNDDGTFGILYDDGDHEPKVPIEFLTAVTVKKDTTGASPTNDSPLSPSSAMLKNGQQIYPVVPQQIR